MSAKSRSKTPAKGLVGAKSASSIAYGSVDRVRAKTPAGRAAPPGRLPFPDDASEIR